MHRVLGDIDRAWRWRAWGERGGMVSVSGRVPTVGVQVTFGG